MRRPRWAGTCARVSAAAALALLLSCSKAADGEVCAADKDCESGSCAPFGRCAPGECACSGDECGKIQSSCRAGAVCVAGQLFEKGYNRCRTSCSSAKPCPPGSSCETDICLPRPDPITLSWVNIPRASPCAARVPCEFIVKPSGNATIDKYRWTAESVGAGSSDPISVPAVGPSALITFTTGGVYSVAVNAVASSGATAELRTTEVLCRGGFGADCDASGSPPCCEGSCTATGLCQ